MAMNNYASLNIMSSIHHNIYCEIIIISKRLIDSYTTNN